MAPQSPNSGPPIGKFFAVIIPLGVAAHLAAAAGEYEWEERRKKDVMEQFMASGHAIGDVSYAGHGQVHRVLRGDYTAFESGDEEFRRVREITGFGILQEARIETPWEFLYRTRDGTYVAFGRKDRAGFLFNFIDDPVDDFIFHLAADGKVLAVGRENLHRRDGKIFSGGREVVGVPSYAPSHLEERFETRVNGLYAIVNNR